MHTTRVKPAIVALMDKEAHPTHLPLAEALIEWSDPALVEAVRAEERNLDPTKLRRHGRFTLVSIRTELRAPQRRLLLSDPYSGLEDLDRVWEGLIGAFKMQVQRRAMVLTGAYIKTEGSPRQVIPADLAARMDIDPASGAVFVGASGSFYTAVTAWRGDVAPTNIDAAMTTADFSDGVPMVHAGTIPITQTSVRELSDDEILALLDEHIRRVLESPGPKMMARVKDVLQPIIVRRLEARCRQGLMHDSLVAEAGELRSWISQVAQWHPLPALKTVQNNIRNTYRQLKAGSKPPI
jgi:hypothetical protein